MSSRVDESYGQGKLSVVDRLGVWLSRRVIARELPDRAGLEVLDLGCGFHAAQLMALSPRLKRGIGIDFQVSPELGHLENLSFHQGAIEEMLPQLASDRFDVVMLISVLEHLAEPRMTIQAAYSLLKPAGILLVNVPTWRGKTVLELSAFRLGLSPKTEMDDHKMYYDKRDLWPILVAAGFKPSLIRLRYYKFGWNLFAVARREDA